ncbi:MAG: uL22 family ribosomal protein, partial [Candidatus Saccharimonadales bacterium]
MRAVAKGIRVSPRKIGVVAALIRSRDVADALVILENTPRGAA